MMTRSDFTPKNVMSSGLTGSNGSMRSKGKLHVQIDHESVAVQSGSKG